MAISLSDLPKKRAPAASRHAAGFDCAIDLVHLSRQTLGDRSLEIELLRLFERQCQMIVARLDGATSSGDCIVRRDLAHTLKGSAQAVGAMAVAAAAAKYEELMRSSQDEAAAEALMDLREAAEDARRAVVSLLPEG